MSRSASTSVTTALAVLLAARDTRRPTTTRCCVGERGRSGGVWSATVGLQRSTVTHGGARGATSGRCRISEPELRRGGICVTNSAYSVASSPVQASECTCHAHAHVHVHVESDQTNCSSVCWMSSRLAAVRAQAGFSLKHFILRTEARSLYRDVLRAIKGMDESTATGVRQAARERFAENANETDVAQIKVLLVDGKHSLKEMISAFGTVR
eukprot:scaffold67318_cov48-Phaeocystis_antarctica.AAC.3